MKKIYLALVLFLGLFVVTGCGNGGINDTPENVAREMAKRMSEGNYTDITKLITDDEQTYIDEISFANYLKENDLNIEGNKKYKVETSKTSQNEISKTVKVKIDNNKILQIKTVKRGEKWYVNLGSYAFDDDLVIKVPTGSIVKLNGNQLDFNKFGKKENISRTSTMGEQYTYNIEVDTYSISSLLEGKYTLTVENSSIQTVNHEIYSNKSYYDRYMEDEKNHIFVSNQSGYVLIPNPNESIKTEVTNYMNNYFTLLIDAINNDKDFNDLKSYLGNIKDSELTIVESNYKKLLKNKDQSTKNIIKKYSEFSLENVSFYEQNGIMYNSDDTIILLVSYEIKYRYVVDYTFTNNFDDDEYKTQIYNAVLHLKKDGQNYKIIGGTSNLIPKI